MLFDSLEDAFDVLERLTGSVDGPDDWALNHDRYLYGESQDEASDDLLMDCEKGKLWNDL